MKRKVGFISNSSSSSYVCDICGRRESGYDQPASDFGMVDHGYCAHCYCEDHGYGISDDEEDPNIENEEEGKEKAECLICRGFDVTEEDVLFMIEILAKTSMLHVRYDLKTKWMRNRKGLEKFLEENKVKPPAEDDD